MNNPPERRLLTQATSRAKYMYSLNAKWLYVKRRADQWRCSQPDLVGPKSPLINSLLTVLIVLGLQSLPPVISMIAIVGLVYRLVYQSRL